MKRKPILNGYGFIDESGTVTNSKNRVIKQQINQSNKLPMIQIYVNGKRKGYFIRNLMIEAFGIEFDNKTHKLIFKDGNKSNSSLNNLKVEPRYAGSQRVTLEKALAIKTLNENDFSYSKLVNIFNVSKTTISRIVNDERLQV